MQKLGTFYPHRTVTQEGIIIVIGLSISRNKVNESTIPMIVIRYIESDRSMTWKYRDGAGTVTDFRSAGLSYLLFWHKRTPNF